MKIVKPPRLRPGDTIAVITPASAPRRPEDFHTGLDYLRSKGYHVDVLRPDHAPHGYLAGSDEERLDELNHYLRRSDVKALFCARGGFGTLRLLPHLDYEAARQHPKLIVGYSDITALHLALFHRAGVPGLSGPMVAVEWHDVAPDEERLFWELVKGGSPQPLLGPRGKHLQPMRPGTAEGVLIGGNLSVITQLVGTPYLPSLDGVILFIEDVNEPPYRIDGMFAHLRLAGLLDRLGGLILGGFTDWEPDDDSPTLTPDEVFDAYLAEAPYPVATGLTYGHFSPKNTMPIGVRARLEVNRRTATLSLLEPVVA